MFEQALYEHIKANFTVSGVTITHGFGVISETAQSPYIVMHVLDSDGSAQVLCDEPFDSGDTFVQWNLYDEAPPYLFKLKRELDLFVSGLRSLTYGGKTYKIGLVQHEPSPSANIIENGLAVDVLAKTITYEEV